MLFFFVYCFFFEINFAEVLNSVRIFDGKMIKVKITMEMDMKELMIMQWNDDEDDEEEQEDK